MDLLIVRHAIAFDRDPAAWPDDAERPLTKQGQRRFRRAARGLKAAAPSPEVFLTSPWLRARQTAEILVEEAGWPIPMTCSALGGGKPDEVMECLKEHPESPLALVGHEPYLGQLLSYLTTGDAARLQVELKKGGAARVTFADTVLPGSAALCWVLTARALRALRP
jgi:phosphohistidine phosphatase